MNKEINEFRTKIDNLKEEVTRDMEKHRKKNETEMRNKRKATPADENKQKTESKNSKMKW
jgi:hypothetical protein